MDNYINKIMSNHVFNSDSSDDLSYLYSEQEHKIKQSGGQKKEDNSKPTGGFPPIFIVDNKEKEGEKSKNRELAPKKIGISIRDILSNKKTI
jgi:hypothetical protein